MSRFRIVQAAAGLCFLVISAVGAAAAAPGQGSTGAPQLPAQIRAVLAAINPADLRGNLSFLASDALEGRYTPSHDLDIAAEFIESRFRAAGLEPMHDGNFFQRAEMVDRRMPEATSPLTLESGNRTITVPASAITISNVVRGANVEHAPVVVLRSQDVEALKQVDIKGKAILLAQPDYAHLPSNEIAKLRRSVRAFDAALASSGASLEIVVGRPQRVSLTASRLISAEDAQQYRVPVLNVENDELRAMLLKTPGQAQAMNASTSIPDPVDQNVTLKNVIGILPGSDPKLKSTYILLTAHYDHIGTTQTAGRMAMTAAGKQAGNDHIYNGANDDGSGTVSVVEIATALAKLKPHPKRSIIFMTFFGEERGEIGSNYYGTHPVVPLADTVADLNLEQVGRTDSTVGPQVNTASLTGYDYSDVTKFLEQAGRQLGVKVYKDAEASDAYFTRSDNDALAQKGIPAHTLTVAFDYPDYHGLADEWQKIDYDNMARVDRMVALGLIGIANSEKPPQWNAANPKTAPFRQARTGDAK